MRVLRGAWFAWVIIAMVYTRDRFGRDAFLPWYGALLAAGSVAFVACVWLIRRRRKSRPESAKV